MAATNSGVSDKDDELLARVLPTVPQLARYERSALEITRLGGLTNLVFKVVPRRNPLTPQSPSSVSETEETQGFCLRCPGPDTEAYISRTGEKRNVLAAARAGVGPQVLYFGDDGVMLMPLLPGQTMSPKRFQSDLGARVRAGKALKQLHSSGETFDATFELFSEIDKYLGQLRSGESAPDAETKNQEKQLTPQLKRIQFELKLLDGYYDTLKEAEVVRAALTARPLPAAPCHCDPLCENFIDDPDTGVMRIVDFEYGGMNDPMWDIADLSVEAGLDNAAEQELIAAYFGDSSPTVSELGRIICYKAMCDLLWTLWGLVQHKNGNPAEDFWAYSIERYERCKTLMVSDTFAAHIAAVREGR